MLLALRGLGSLRQATHIYFCRELFETGRGSFWLRFVMKFSRWISPKAQVELVSPNDVRDLSWNINLQAPETVDAMGSAIRQNRSYRFIAALFHNEDVMRFFKAFLSTRITNQILFCQMAQRLHHLDSQLVIFPDDPDYPHTFDMAAAGELMSHVPFGVAMINRVRGWFKFCQWWLLLEVLPLGYLLRALWSQGFRFRATRRHAAVLLPVVWGIHEGINIVGGVRKHVDDTYVYGNGIKPGDVLHLFSNQWRLSEQQKIQYKQAMQRSGMSFADVDAFVCTAKFIWECLRLQLRVLIESMVLPSAFRFNILCQMAAVKAIYVRLGLILQSENISCQVAVIKNDYDPGHILVTLYYHEFGAKTLGVQHTATSYDLPQLAFVTLDSYLVYGELYVRTFGSFWKELPLRRVGRENLDGIVKLERDGEQKIRLHDKMLSKYPHSRFKILILMSSPSYDTRPVQWREMYEACRAFESVQLDATVFLRFRRMSHVDDLLPDLDFKALCSRDSRLVIESENFTTPELMVLSDLVITPNSSFSINEALAIHKPVFTFDYTGAARLYYSSYGNDFVLNTRDDILRVIKSVETGYDGFDCKWKRLSSDCNYHADGHNTERLRQEIRALMISSQPSGLSEAA